MLYLIGMINRLAWGSGAGLVRVVPSTGQGMDATTMYPVLHHLIHMHCGSWWDSSCRSRSTQERVSCASAVHTC